MHSLFEMYLCRRAKANGSLVISIQPTTILANVTSSLWIDLINSNKLSKKGIPHSCTMLVTQLRKNLGHFFVYWVLPLSLMEKPFTGKSSYILRKGNAGMRDSDYRIVFNERDKMEYIKDGVRAQKLYILEHPLSRVTTQNIMLQAYGAIQEPLNNTGKVFKTALILLPGEKTGFNQKDLKLITEEDREQTRLEIISLICISLKEWHIKLKPHPIYTDSNSFMKKISDNFPLIEIIDSSEAVEPHLVNYTDLVIDLPRSASSVLETAARLGIISLSLDINKELTGDIFKSYPGITYIDNIQKLSSILSEISNKFVKTKTHLYNIDIVNDENSFIDFLEQI